MPDIIRDCESCSAEPARATAQGPVRTRSANPGGRREDFVVALAGNPNTGKSTVFNALTGLRQHTGNWPGKTVARAEGIYEHRGKTYRLVDLPGTYSLLAASVDEEVARDYLLFGKPEVTVVVVDATRLERNLNLVLQVLEITDRAVVCLNLVDEARRHAVEVDAAKLSELLGIPVVPTSARFGTGMAELREAIEQVATGVVVCSPRRVQRFSEGVQSVLTELEEAVCEAAGGISNARWVAMRLLDGDVRIAHAIREGQLGSNGDGRPAEVGPREPSPALLSTDAEVLAGRASLLSRASLLRWEVGPRFHECVVESVYAEAAAIADACVRPHGDDTASRWDRRLDRLFTSRWTGVPVMILLLVAALWVTIVGANYPSRALAWLLMDEAHPALKALAAAVGLPWWLDGLLIDGVYLATAWVIAVMLPPMAIFFPLFTLLEDFGYLPRVAFNLDGCFRRCGAHGKQALTMCMGLGCNAAGVIAARVIDSPRERLIAIITNNFSLCNGRWPTLILVATVFVGAMGPTYLAGLVSAVAVVGVAVLGFALTFAVSWGLSRTVLRGEPSIFSLELPPYRPPRLWQTLYTSLIDRTLFVLWRAVVFAVPAGAVIWLVANVTVGDQSIAERIVTWLDPVGVLLGLNGVILLAYIIAIPANEIVIPTILMLTVLMARLSGVGEQGAGVMFEADANVTRTILDAGGWTLLTAVNLMLFSLLHNPCSTTIYTIWKETRSGKWTTLATLLPLAVGLLVCLLVAQSWRLMTMP
ncbi:MAG: ferrous iron transport protein B [Patescibacteria group bacterium]|nr:ferrous iron transport protein B [Patescibacteria group bacterium]